MPNLTNIPALDVVIGLAFVYFILSLVLSSVTEAISAVLNVRWAKLEQGMRELFLASDGDTGEAETLWHDFQQNPRIQALWKKTGTLGQRGPSYIPPRTFALTLLDTLAPPLDAHTVEDALAAAAAATARAAASPEDAKAAALAKAAADAAVRKAGAAKAFADAADAQAAADAKASAVDAQKAAAAEASAAIKAAADAQDEAAAAAFKAAAAPSDKQAAAAAEAAAANASNAVAQAAAPIADRMMSDHDLVARARRAAASVHHPLLRKWLLDAVTEVETDREKILTSLEEAYNSVTNRVSGWYKRYSTIVVAVLAVLAAGALNVDSYAIGSRLWKDDAVRTAIANQAASATKLECPPPSAKPKSGKGAGSAAGATTTGTNTATGTTTKNPLESATQCVTGLKALGLPIGWAKENRPDTGWGWLGKVFGMIVTAFALMLGAPFWFDTLGKLARLRATGNPEGTAKKNGTTTQETKKSG